MEIIVSLTLLNIRNLNNKKENKKTDFDEIDC